jgi:cephalosporin hydroxylase
MMRVVASSWVLLQLATALKVQPSNVTSGSAVVLARQAPETFEGFYDAHTHGRGIWKWNNALVAYQRHFAALAGTQLAVAEVGVQSGGSLLMWQAVFGAQIQLYGLDINPACKTFENTNVHITLGDQGDPAMWKSFFKPPPPALELALDILVDDGGHEPQQMLTTTYGVFPHIRPGGWVVIEDIHGPSYLQSFFMPVAKFIDTQAKEGLVESVHVYPFLLMLHKSGPNKAATPPATGQQTEASDLPSTWEAIKSSKGGVVVLRNASWGSLLTADGLTNIFHLFNGLHGGAFVHTPKGCGSTAAAVCTNRITNEVTQNLVEGIHIYSDRLEVDVPSPQSPPVIEAVRKGTDWMAYGF